MHWCLHGLLEHCMGLLPGFEAETPSSFMDMSVPLVSRNFSCSGVVWVLASLMTPSRLACSYLAPM